MRPYAMTSGSRGLHVVAPLRRRHDSDTVRARAGELAELLVERHPHGLTTAWRKEKRGGRVLVDVARNTYGQTTVAPYAVRALPGAPVATPLAWEELGDDDLHPRRWALAHRARARRGRAATRGRGSPATPRRCPEGWYSAPIGALSSTLDGTFFALSDPTRRGILERLGGGPATISELATPLGLTINGVKKHVGILERADLVVTEKIGRARHCRLGAADLAEATAWIDGHRQAWEHRLDRFERYVERTAGGAE